MASPNATAQNGSTVIEKKSTLPSAVQIDPKIKKNIQLFNTLTNIQLVVALATWFIVTATCILSSVFKRFDYMATCMAGTLWALGLPFISAFLGFRAFSNNKSTKMLISHFTLNIICCLSYGVFIGNVAVCLHWSDYAYWDAIKDNSNTTIATITSITRTAFFGYLEATAIIFEIFFMLGAIANLIASIFLILVAIRHWFYTKRASTKPENVIIIGQNSSVAGGNKSSATPIVDPKIKKFIQLYPTLTNIQMVMAIAMIFLVIMTVTLGHTIRLGNRLSYTTTCMTSTFIWVPILCSISGFVGALAFIQIWNSHMKQRYCRYNINVLISHFILSIICCLSCGWFIANIATCLQWSDYAYWDKAMDILSINATTTTVSNTKSAYFGLLDAIAIILETFFMLLAVTNFITNLLLVLFVIRYWSNSSKSKQASIKLEKTDDESESLTVSTVAS